MNNKDIMNLAIKQAEKTMNKDIGGPFGAAIVRNGKVIAVASNTVLGDNDPTAHAEINAIRKAGAKLKTHDLSDCTLYATGYPCPMCLSAIIWANIKDVYYGTDLDDAEEIGFRDDFIYKYIGDLKEKQQDESILCLESMGRDDAIRAFQQFAVKSNKIIY